MLSEIEFGLLSKNEIHKISVVEITTHEMYEKGLPKNNGLCDLRLGTIDRQYICHTCNHDALRCEGHFGHIDLAFPVFHICFMKYVVKVLNCVCVECGGLKEHSDTKLKNHARLKYMYNELKNKTQCNICTCTQPKITMDKTEVYFNKEKKSLWIKFQDMIATGIPSCG